MERTLQWKVKRIRKIAGISQVELSKNCACSQSVISKFERTGLVSKSTKHSIKNGLTKAIGKNL